MQNSLAALQNIEADIKSQIGHKGNLQLDLQASNAQYFSTIRNFGVKFSMSPLLLALLCMQQKLANFGMVGLMLLTILHGVILLQCIEFFV